jgi:hypothetical protein
MRQWTGALVLLVVVAMMAAFAVGSVITVVAATEVLQRTAVTDVDSALYAESFDDCEAPDSETCF